MAPPVTYLQGLLFVCEQELTWSEMSLTGMLILGLGLGLALRTIYAGLGLVLRTHGPGLVIKALALTSRPRPKPGQT